MPRRYGRGPTESGERPDGPFGRLLFADGRGCHDAAGGRVAQHFAALGQRERLIGRDHVLTLMLLVITTLTTTGTTTHRTHRHTPTTSPTSTTTGRRGTSTTRTRRTETTTGTGHLPRTRDRKSTL